MMHTKVRDLTLEAVFLALLIVFAMVPGMTLGFLPVPVVMQNLGVMLIALILGARRGSLVMSVFIIMIALGLPVLTGGHGGMAVLVGPTAGYIWAWLFQPAVFAFLSRFWPKKGGQIRPGVFQSFVLIFMIDLVLVYGMGAVWLSFSSHMTFGQAYLGNMLFVPGDIVKVILATVIVKALPEKLFQ
ncbi:biotin transporter BioY [Fructobacillus sp. M1-13]|uniref:Biotin transporter n=1 Tax=Fructobacillus papyriferae TaxID=2713171 RepID=A0ABS5QNR7_9LACO|nr:biotin transporter BioY [Fructobacillus papyriferae]MBS9334773.1 biotin transporter BioY [Fructobacillus papyriferae]MCD2158763.1 biotin transporter BioY [Fructobacillus papyriferae]